MAYCFGKEDIIAYLTANMKGLNCLISKCLFIIITMGHPLLLTNNNNNLYNVNLYISLKRKAVNNDVALLFILVIYFKSFFFI